MMHFISKGKLLWRRIGVLLFWIIIWHIISVWIGQEILVVSPVSVCKTLFYLCKTSEFWISVASSLYKILVGYIGALTVGMLFAAFSYQYSLVRELLAPLMKMAQAMPVASFVILALVWIRSKNLSILISFLMACPVFYLNLYQGLVETDCKLLEMAQVYRMSVWRKGIYIYFPSLLPYLLSSATLCAGLCWKSGIAAEVIGLPNNSIGSALYDAKIFLNTSGLFAWTFVIVLISVLFEKFVLFGIHQIQRHLERG